MRGRGCSIHFLPVLPTCSGVLFLSVSLKDEASFVRFSVYDDVCYEVERFVFFALSSYFFRGHTHEDAEYLFIVFENRKSSGNLTVKHIKAENC